MNVTNDARPGDDEVRRLQSFINDLISVQALPAIWDRQDASHIVGTLLDVLVSVLRLDFAYARLSDSIIGPPAEMVRLAGRRTSDPAPESIRQAISPWLAGGPHVQPLIVPHPLVRGNAAIWPFPLGLAEKLGVVICGTARTDFPTKAETILARVAVNQAVVGLQEARLLGEQMKHAAELELRITERTGQLTAVKDELAAELAAMTRLHQLSTRLLARAELQPLLEEILDATMALLHADFGNVQLYNPKTQALEIVAHRGFKKDFLDYFNLVQEGTASCGMAWQRGERVVVEDVLTDRGFAPHLEIVAAAGYRAVQSTPLFRHNGEPLGMISTHFRQPHRPSERELRLTDLYARQAVELIERKRAEEALCTSEEHFRHLVEGVKDYALYMLDLDGRVVTWNDGAKRMKGYSSEEILGRHISLFYEPHDVESGQPQRALTEAVATGRFEDEGWRVRKDGSRFWANIIVTALKDETGGIRGFSKMTRDMTERKRTNEALRESEARFRSYFELGLIGMAITSPTKGILEVNDELCRILGFERGELLQKTWVEMTHPNDRAADVENFNRVMAGEMDGYTLDKRWICKEGRVIDSIVAAKCLRLADGSVDYFVGLVLDTTERKRSEKKLHRSEANLAEGQRLSHTASWAWNVATGEVFWSQELFRIYGLAPERVKPGYSSVLSYIHPEDRLRAQKTFEDAVREKRDYELAYRVVWVDGTIRHVNNIAHPVFDEAGTLTEYVGTTIDTTERIQAEEKLRRSEANLAEGQRISHTGSWAWNTATEEMFCSQELLRIFGLDAPNAKPRHEDFLLLIHSEDQPRVREAFDRAVRTRSNYDVKYRILRDGRSIRHIHNVAHPVLNESGELHELVGTAVDITERKQAEEAVRKAHKHVDLILTSISDQFCSLNKDWRFTYFNQHAAAQMKLLGKDAGQLIGKVLWEEFPDLPNEANLRRVMSERVPITDEFYYPALGEWVENHMYPSHDGGLVTFQRYITARKQTEEELHKTQAELAHVTRVTTMGELAASIAHEINQPLGAIVNNSNVGLRLVNGARGLSHELRAVLSDIVHDANRASDIITRIRAMTRRALPEKILLQLKDVIADVLALANRELTERRITVRTEFPENLPFVSGDRVQLQQVLLNLVMNSIEAMSDVADEQRVLTIRGMRDELAGHAAVRITVHDLGSGFRPEDSERLFESFYTTKLHGLGMGLRISRSIVEAHGGRLWATANDGPGATISCTLLTEA